jgi:hypothetical protein
MQDEMKSHPHSQRRNPMFRKITLALATTAALGAAALAPTSASAFGGHFGHGPVVGGPHFAGGFGPHYGYGPHFGHRWGGWGWGGVGVGVAAGLVGGAIAADTCLRREVFDTPYGPRYRWVNVCY